MRKNRIFKEKVRGTPSTFYPLSLSHSLRVILIRKMVLVRMHILEFLTWNSHIILKEEYH